MTVQPQSPGAAASGSSFYAAMRLLPVSEREAMFAVYAFCRQVDDIADEPHFTTAERLAGLDRWREALAATYAGQTPAEAAFLAGPIQRFGLRQEDFQAVIDGMQMDVGEPIQAPDFTTFDLYCDRVASAVGRLSVRVFGMGEEPGLQLAHHLGRALQFTNILRDLDEDAAINRLYLPAEALQAGGIEITAPLQVLAHAGIDPACRWVARLAQDHYRAADAVIRRRPGGRLRAPRLMGAVYGDILRRMDIEGWAAPRPRVKLAKTRLLWLALRHGIFA